jgi:hypothetical protein
MATSAVRVQFWAVQYKCSRANKSKGRQITDRADAVCNQREREGGRTDWVSSARQVCKLTVKTPCPGKPVSPTSAGPPPWKQRDGWAARQGLQPLGTTDTGHACHDPYRLNTRAGSGLTAHWMALLAIWRPCSQCCCSSSSSRTTNRSASYCSASRWNRWHPQHRI